MRKTIRVMVAGIIITSTAFATAANAASCTAYSKGSCSIDSVYLSGSTRVSFKVTKFGGCNGYFSITSSTPGKTYVVGTFGSSTSNNFNFSPAYYRVFLDPKSVGCIKSTITVG